MKTRITLVNPPYPAGSHQHPPFMPLGIGYLGAVLEKNHFEVKVIDCQAQKISHDQFKEVIAKIQTGHSWRHLHDFTYKSALKIVKSTKEALPNCITAVGGPHVTFWDDKALQEAPSLDVIVRGEGEETMLELAQRVENNQPLFDLPGTTCRKGNEIVKNADRPFLETSTAYPFPPFTFGKNWVNCENTEPYPIPS